MPYPISSKKYRIHIISHPTFDPTVYSDSINGGYPTVLRHHPETRRNHPWNGYYQDYRLSLRLNTSRGGQEK